MKECKFQLKSKATTNQRYNSISALKQGGISGGYNKTENQSDEDFVTRWIQWTPLNRFPLGRTKTDSIYQMIRITEHVCAIERHLMLTQSELV